MPPASAAAACLSHPPARAHGPAAPRYEQRRPETGVLFHTLQQHLATFEASLADPEHGRALPDFVTEELRGFLGCGDLARGFGHVRCEDCGDSRLVAFGCKGRGFCPRCLGRRMNEGAANLAENVATQCTSRSVSGPRWP
jgi:hypothetical protein